MFLIFFPVERGEYSFVVVTKRLIDFDGNKPSCLSMSKKLMGHIACLHSLAPIPSI